LGSQDSQSRRFDAERERFRARGQDHVFRFWDRLGSAARERLLEQAARVDLDMLARTHAAELLRVESPPLKLETVPVERLPGHGGDPDAQRDAARVGELALAAGRVAALVVAGGQATRLGFAGPKGGFPVGPITGRTLFEQQAQKLRGLRRRFERPLPWYVMTSQATDADTRKLFEDSGYFGLPAEDVFLFEQAMVQSLDFEGRLMLERPDRIFENPNGHGGALTALLSSGALDDMEGRGVDTLFYYQVDNPLIRIADPAYLGFHLSAGAQMSCKVLRKEDPMERVGVVARANGRIGIVEYTEIDDDHRFATDAAGDLVYWAGNTAIHVFETSFAREVATRADELLPYHASAKKIPTLDESGNAVVPEEPNGRKLERFVFDALGAAQTVCLVEAERALDYSPIKNAEGTDSPITARRDLVTLYRTWLEAAGIEVPVNASIEIDHSRIDGPEDVKGLEIQHLDDARDVIHIESGTDS
jgi:UDP-N-acetylglucosamine/UDP-N-acetylgalactosamine diphosphorylase